jgi:hypothetical protein
MHQLERKSAAIAESKSSSANWLVRLLSYLYPSSKKLVRQARVHDYSQYQPGVDYVVEAAQEAGSLSGYLTGQGRDIQQGDYILLHWDGSLTKCRIEKIDYYINPPDMWMALIVRVGNR